MVEGQGEIQAAVALLTSEELDYSGAIVDFGLRRTTIKCGGIGSAEVAERSP